MPAQSQPWRRSSDCGGSACARARHSPARCFLPARFSPALGFFNVFPFIYSYVADHFQCLACLGVIVPVSAGLVSALSSPGWPP
jgi:hypothetical protein